MRAAIPESPFNRNKFVRRTAPTGRPIGRRIKPRCSRSDCRVLKGRTSLLSRCTPSGAISSGAWRRSPMWRPRAVGGQDPMADISSARSHSSPTTAAPSASHWRPNQLTAASIPARPCSTVWVRGSITGAMRSLVVTADIRPSARLSERNRRYAYGPGFGAQNRRLVSDVDTNCGTKIRWTGSNAVSYSKVVVLGGGDVGCLRSRLT